MRTILRLPLACLAATLLHTASLHAQDSHYGSQQYGARAELLGGSVIGSLVGVSSTFYNPGAVVLVAPSEYLLSAEPFELQRVSVTDGAAPGEDLSTLSLRGAPSLFAGLLPTGWLGGRWAYSTLTRHRFKLALKNRYGDTRDLLPNPGLETYVAETTFDQNLDELWAGLTWSRRVGDRMGVGLTHYFTYRGQSSRSQAVAQVTADDGTGASATIIDDFDYWTLGLLWKLGVAFDYSPVSFGFSLTTPDVDFYRTGSAFFNRNVTNVDLDESGVGTSLTLTDYKTGLSATHHSPLAIGAGCAYRFRNSGIHVSAEWYAAVPRYVVMDAGTSDQLGGKILTRRLTDEADDVINVSVGVEHSFNARLMYFGSFRTDFSSHVPGSEANLSISSWNLYHVSSGATVTFKGVDVTLGVTYAFGHDDVLIPVDPQNAGKENLFLGEGSAARVNYSSFRVLFGFAFKTS